MHKKAAKEEEKKITDKFYDLVGFCVEGERERRRHNQSYLT
jgi:hypothetical protein